MLQHQLTSKDISVVSCPVCVHRQISACVTEAGIKNEKNLNGVWCSVYTELQRRSLASRAVRKPASVSATGSGTVKRDVF